MYCIFSNLTKCSEVLVVVRFVCCSALYERRTWILNSFRRSMSAATVNCATAKISVPIIIKVAAWPVGNQQQGKHEVIIAGWRLKAKWKILIPQL